MHFISIGVYLTLTFYNINDNYMSFEVVGMENFHNETDTK